MRLLWEEEAWEDYCLWQTRDKKRVLNAIRAAFARDDLVQGSER